MKKLPPFYNMTAPQREIMTLVVSSIDKMGQSPTLQELADATGREVPNVHKTVKRLVELGHLQQKPGAYRGITLPEVAKR